VIYKGCEIKHGRERFDVATDSYHVNVFLHYSQEQVHRYDGHGDLGIYFSAIIIECQLMTVQVCHRLQQRLVVQHHIV